MSVGTNVRMVRSTLFVVEEQPMQLVTRIWVAWNARHI